LELTKKIPEKVWAEAMQDVTQASSPNEELVNQIVREKKLNGAS
jgi:hypothetical protein